MQKGASLCCVPQGRQDGNMAKAHQHEAQVEELVLLLWRDPLISRCLQRNKVS